jgi:hypothetical protein
MTSVPPPDFRKEIEVVRFDPLSLERQRNRLAGRGVTLLILLNSAAALILLANFTTLTPRTNNAPTLIDAMVVLGSGSIAGLASIFFAYLRRTVALEAPERVALRMAARWLAVLAAMASAACFLVGLNMAGAAVKSDLKNTTSLSKSGLGPGTRELPGVAGPQGPKGDKGERGEKGDAGPSGLQEPPGTPNLQPPATPESEGQKSLPGDSGEDDGSAPSIPKQGVIKPPATGDTGINATVPNPDAGSSEEVIPPPGTPGGTPDAEPK